MPTNQSHCRLCAEPSARSRLVCLDDEVIDIKQKMLLINVDVSTPSPLPRGVCYSCLCLLERTCTFLHQVRAAQDKLSLIYQDTKDHVEESDNMDEDFDFGLKEEPSDDDRAEIKTESCQDELPLPEESRPVSAEPIQIITAEKRKRGRPKKKVKKNIDEQKDTNKLKYPATAAVKKKCGRPRKESNMNNSEKELDKGEERNSQPKDEPNNNKDTPKPKRRKKKAVKTRNFFCECGKGWQTQLLLDKHKIKHSERSRDFYCHICGKSFMDNAGLMGHLLLHGEKRFNCEVCGKKFHTLKHLKRHATQHSSARPFECDQCGKTFAQKRHLQFHSAVHSDLRPYVCSYCQKGFKTKTVFNVHVRMHTGVRPYSCEHCGNDYFDHSTLYKHVRSVHGADPRRRKQVDNNSDEIRYKEIAELMLQNS